MPDILTQQGKKDVAPAAVAEAPLPFVGIRSRFLPPAEWERLRDYGPFAAAGGVLPDAAHAVVLVMERWADGKKGPQLVGCWVARDIVMLEGLYLNPEERGLAPSAKLHFTSMMDELGARGVSQVITLVQDLAVMALAHKAGFTMLPGAVVIHTLPKGEHA